MGSGGGLVRLFWQKKDSYERDGYEAGVQPGTFVPKCNVRTTVSREFGQPPLGGAGRVALRQGLVCRALNFQTARRPGPVIGTFPRIPGPSPTLNASADIFRFQRRTEFEWYTVARVCSWRQVFQQFVQQTCVTDSRVRPK